MDIKEIIKVFQESGNSKDALDKLDITDKFKISELAYKVQVLSTVAVAFAMDTFVKEGIVNPCTDNKEWQELMQTLTKKSILESIQLYLEDRELFEEFYKETYEDYEKYVGDTDENEQW